MPYSSSARTVLLRQPDGSYTAFQIANTTPYPTLSTIPNYPKAFLACPSAAPVAGGSDPEAFAKLKSGGYLFVQQHPPSSYSYSNSQGAIVDVEEFDSALRFVAESHFSLPFANQYVNFGSLALVDLNGDGNLDIVEAMGAGDADTQYAYVVVLMGTAGAAFGVPTVYRVAAGMLDTNATSIAIGDFNGDGKLDLAVSTWGFQPTISVLMGNGDGTFQAEQIVSQTVGGGQIVVADFNRDGKPDLACINISGGFVSFFLGNGDGTFSAPRQYSVRTNTLPFSGTLTVGDVDGDGNPDIIAGGISILFGNGKGGFPRRRDFLVETRGNLILTDFNGDGIPDIVVGNGNPDVLGGQFLAVLLGKGGGNFVGPRVSFGDDTGETYAGSLTGVTADFNGDGIPDIATRTQVFNGLGDGTFSAGVALALPANCNASAVTTADFNRDGHPDLAVICGGYQATQSIEIFLNTGNGTFAAPIQTVVNIGARSTLSAGPKVLLAADFNGDGKPDLVFLAETILGSANSPQSDLAFVLLGNGDGTFAAPASFSPGPTPWSMAAGDFNGDGKLDLEIVFEGGQTSNGTDSGVSLFAGKGDGTFGAAVPLSLPPAFSPIDVVAADFNHDGKLDLAVTFGSVVVGVYLGQGNGTFQAPAVYPLPYGLLAVGDLNGDGILDLISGGAYLLGYGDGTFQPFTAISTAVTALIPGDFNHDGKLDLAGAIGGFGLVTFQNTSQLGGGLPLRVMSSASLSAGPVAPSSLATIFGQNLATATASGDPTNPPATLGGTSVTVQDSAGTSRTAPLLYASPDQINFLVPDGTAAGLATVTVAGMRGPQSVGAQILPVAPALFTLNATGLPAAYLVRVTAAGVQTTESVYTVQNGFLVPAPIDMGPVTDQVYLILYGTGIRGAAAGTAIPTLALGDATYAGPQSQVPGLDQINFLLSRSNAGTGPRGLQLQVDGVYTNTIWITFQ